MKGIGGTQRALVSAVIQIPFRDLAIIIDVHFLRLESIIPTLLSMKYMVTNGLDISIQGCYMSLEGRRQKLSMQNYFLIHQWKKYDAPYVIYT